jgi:hypothetical protein
MEERERFLENRDCDCVAAFRLRIPFMAKASRLGECIVEAKTRKTAEATEVIDLDWDAEAKDRSLDQAASLPVPARW